MAAARSAGFDRALQRLHDLAGPIVAGWADQAAGTLTAGQERALLRVMGVTGIDAAGRPLAAEVVDRWLAGPADRLGRGIVLPFAVALHEYDTTPQALALDIASGAVDLGLEAELLSSADRRAAAETEARRLVNAGLARIDANRLARRELIEMLGEPARPWVGTTLDEPTAADAAGEAALAIRAGADLLRLEVPSGRELTVRLEAAGVELRRWEPRRAASAGEAGPPGPLDQAPAGSERGLAALRGVVDATAAEHGGYVRLATSPPALSAPEGAVVAAFERVDLVESDPIDEIVAIGVDPQRALADHAFARRLDRRAGAAILVGAGPLVVAPDLARGLPSEPGARAGRGLALQLLSAGLAAADGLAADQVLLGAMPPWLLGERRPFALAAAEIALRRALLPANPLVFTEPPDSTPSGPWAFLLGALLPAGPPAALVIRRAAGTGFADVVHATRSAAAVAAELADAVDPGRLRGRSLEHAQAALRSAIETLEALASRGWSAVLGEGAGDVPGRAGWVGRGHDSVARRTDPFDAIGEALASVPA